MKKPHHQPPIPVPPVVGARPLHEVIAVLAYELWVGHGRPDHQAEATWLEAEGRLVKAQSPSPHNLPLQTDS